MINKLIKKIVGKIPYLNLEYELHYMVYRGWLNECGWKESLLKKTPVDKYNQPIAWLTYSFLYFIEEKLNNKIELFEYGSGNSTIYFSKKVKRVYSVENDYNFYNNLLNKMPNNVIYSYCEIKGNNYPEYILQYNKMFDIIIIDGRQRVKCIYNAVKCLKDNGVIIFDNSLRDKYKSGIDFLISLGFRYLHFKGLNPLGTGLTVTTVFYKDNNVLNI